MAHALAAVAPLMRTFTGTLVAVCSADQLDETQSALHALHARAAVRPVVVTFGDLPQPPMRDVDGATIVAELLPRYLDNVVAARRLSSLPALAWWRGGDPGALAALAPLVDRLVLDSQDPSSDWSAATRLLEVTALSDLRWTRLTRWRNLMAQFFDLPAIREAAARFSTLEIDAGDEPAARLLAAWLSRRLPTAAPLQVRIMAAPHSMSRISLAGPQHRLELSLTAAGTCVRASVTDAAQRLTERTVSLGNQSLAALLEEEMRIRARDGAFEDALRTLVEAA